MWKTDDLKIYNQKSYKRLMILYAQLLQDNADAKVLTNVELFLLQGDNFSEPKGAF